MEALSCTYDGKQVVVSTDNGTLYLIPLLENIIRAVYTKRDRLQNDSDIIAIPASACSASCKIEETMESFIVSTTQLSVTIEKKNGRFTWKNVHTGKTLLREAGKILADQDVVKYAPAQGNAVVHKVKTVDGERNFISNLVPTVERTAYRAKLCFDWKQEEAIYGLGQAEEGIFNYRGHHQYLYQHNMRIPMPWLLSSEGYGLLVDCGCLMTFQDDHNGSYLFMDTVEQLDYYFIAGQSFDQIISGYRALTGKAAMLPKWAFGYIQSKEAYETQDELVQVVAEYRRRGVPLDCIVQDWHTWEEGKWGQKTLDPSRYPNMREASQKIHDMNVHTMVAMWPNINASAENYEELANAGHILGDGATYNAFDGDARKIYWEQAKRGLFDCGFDAWWCDACEPFCGPDWWRSPVKREPWERYQLVGGEHKKHLDATQANTYALMHAKGIYENQRACSEKRVLNLIRSGYASQQRYGAVLWSGDIKATWHTLKLQITEGLNLCMSGLPYWTLDIGGFFTVGTQWQRRGCSRNTDPSPYWFWEGDYNEGVEDLGYRELYVRWFQYGAFLPIFRSHGTDTPREIWRFGEKGQPFYDAIEKFIHLRYTLMPYIYALAGQTFFENDTMLRSLMFDYADDPNVKNISSQFMLGRAFLVCPVTKPMYFEANSKPIDVPKTQQCYLPSSASWVDFWTGKQYCGGQYVEAQAPLDQMPLYVRAGAIIPMAHGLQYACQESTKPMEIKIYKGADGHFTLYEDEGNGYQYEQGAYSAISFEWQESTGVLTIGQRKGAGYRGMAQQRNFLITVGEASIEVDYNGEQMEVFCG